MPRTRMKLLSICALYALLSLAVAAHDLSAAYPFRTTLLDRGEDSYELFWRFDRDLKNITFAVRVNTTGWVGFGLSPNGGMVNSDVVIGWVDASGQGYLHDRFATARALPSIDPKQNWFLLNAEEENGFTVLEFTRDWITCDEDRDRVIDASTLTVIFSWNDNDPLNNDPMAAMYHGSDQRRSASLNLLGGLNNPPPTPADSTSFFIGVNNTELPSADTTYWCVVRKLPDVYMETQHYVYKFEPSIEPGNEAFVHHIIVYQCDTLTTGITDGQSQACDATAGGTVSECRTGTIIGGWAVGGTAFIYPEGIANPIEAQYVVIEMHYDNPDRLSGVIDNSGMQFFVTKTAPTHEAAQLSIGGAVTPILMIPPNTNSFTITALCTAACTEKYFPPSGITIIANFFHTHLTGRALIFQHYRMNKECGRLEELEPIDFNPSYDFNYQQTLLLQEPRVVLPLSVRPAGQALWLTFQFDIHATLTPYPKIHIKSVISEDSEIPEGTCPQIPPSGNTGDILRLQCTYNTTNRSVITVGGEGTREEMCFAFPIYYPRASGFGFCGSITSADAMFRFSQEIDVSDDLRMQLTSTLQRLYFPENSQQLQELYNRLDWSPEQIKLFQETVNSDSFTYCGNNETDLLFDSASPNPEPQCDYITANECPGRETTVTPCCQRTLAGAAAATSHLLLILAAALLCALARM